MTMATGGDDTYDLGRYAHNTKIKKQEGILPSQPKKLSSYIDR